MITGELSGHHYVFIDRQNDSDVVLLLLHGTGGDELNLLPLAEQLDLRAHILSPRGNVNEHGMLRYFKRLGDNVFDEEDLRNRSNELAEFIKSAQVKHSLQSKKLIAVGFSNGANMAAAMLLLHPGALNGALLYRALLPIQPESEPDLHGAPVLLMNGSADPMIGRQQAEKLHLALNKYGADAEQIWLPTGHGLTPEDVELGKEWLGEKF